MHSKCNQIMELQKELDELHKKYLFLHNLVFPEKEDIMTNSYFESGIKNSYTQELKELMFLTATIDMSSHPELNSERKQHQYLMYILKEAHKLYPCRMYGCLEHQKNFTLHIHTILESDQINDIHDFASFIKSHLTNNVRNRYCIRLDPVGDSKKNQSTGNSGIDGVIDYINKEKYYNFSK